MPFFDPIRIGASGVSDTAFTVDRSLRFDDGSSTKLTRTFGTNTSNTTKTVSVWVKRSHLGSFQSIFATTSSGFIESRLQFTNTDELQYTDRDSGSGSTDIQKITTQKFRDPSAWFHIVLAIDTTDSTADDRVKIYVNGTRVTDFSSSTNPSSSYAVSFFRSSADNFIGANNTTDFFDGYLAEINFCDGQFLDQSSFAETDATTGQWIPKDTSGLTFGTNGFNLKFADNSGTSATTLGKDSSGNSNNFTLSNFGTGDAVKDSPTNNFCTLSSITDAGALFGSSTLSEAGLRYTGGSSNRSIAGTFGIRHDDTTGYYFECRIISGNTANRNFVGIGYASTDWQTTDARGANNDSWVLRNGDGVFIHNSSVDGETTGAGGLSVGDIIQIAVKANKIWVGVNNTYLFSGNPAGDSTPKFSDIAETWLPVMDLMTSNVNQFNFGQDSSFSNSVTAQGNTDGNGHGDFYYAPPTGFFALCSANLPDPSILLPNVYFDVLTWTGNSTNNRAITGLQFQPDFVWIKKRTSSAAQHSLVDSIRGTSDNSTGNGNVGDLDSTSSRAPAAQSAGGFESFDSNGFTLGKGSNDANADSAYQLNNASGQTYVAWNWFAGGSTATNSNGTISSQVRASATSGFSLAFYTGNGSAGATVGHGLGVAPDAVLVKRINASDDWRMNIGPVLPSGNAGHSLKLNSTGGINDANNLFNSTDPTSTVFTIGDNADVNGNTSTYLAYCFSSVTNFSKVGTFEGNSNANGVVVNLGFKPAWLLLKHIDGESGAYWLMLDSTRRTFNPNGPSSSLYANTNETENTFGNGTGIDFLSSGFKIRDSLSYVNTNTIFYIAFAESPFKNSRAV